MTMRHVNSYPYNMQHLLGTEPYAKYVGKIDKGAKLIFIKKLFDV